MASWPWEPEVPMFNLEENNNSSTEANIFEVDDVLTQVIWTQYFLKDPEYDIHDNVIYKDNQNCHQI